MRRYTTFPEQKSKRRMEPCSESFFHFHILQSKVFISIYLSINQIKLSTDIKKHVFLETSMNAFRLFASVHQSCCCGVDYHDVIVHLTR